MVGFNRIISKRVLAVCAPLGSRLLCRSQTSIQVTRVLQLAIDNGVYSIFHGSVRGRSYRVRRASDDPEPIELHSTGEESVTRVHHGVRIVIGVQNAVV